MINFSLIWYRRSISRSSIFPSIIRLSRLILVNVQHSALDDSQGQHLPRGHLGRARPVCVKRAPKHRKHPETAKHERGSSVVYATGMWKEISCARSSARSSSLPPQITSSSSVSVFIFSPLLVAAPCGYWSLGHLEFEERAHEKIRARTASRESAISFVVLFSMNGTIVGNDGV